MASDSYDLSMEQGMDWEWTIRWKVGKNRLTAVPKDINGFVGHLVLAKDYGTTVLLHLQNSNGGCVLDIPNAGFTFIATNTQTGGLAAGKYKYDAYNVSPTGKKKKMAKGIVTVSPKVG